VTTMYRRVVEVLRDLVQLLMHAAWWESRQRRAVGPRLSAGSAQRGGSGKDGAVKHVGATESFGRELRNLRNVEVSPELISDIETELRWGLVWHEFEKTMQAEVDRIFAPCLELVECKDFDEVRELAGLPELAAA
jgi:hypothetical protein